MAKLKTYAFASLLSCFALFGDSQQNKVVKSFSSTHNIL